MGYLYGPIDVVINITSLRLSTLDVALEYTVGGMVGNWSCIILSPLVIPTKENFRINSILLDNHLYKSI